MAKPRLIDSHLHLWRLDPSKARGILTDQRFKPEIDWADYAAARDGIALDGVVAVQVWNQGDGEAEVEFFERAAAAHPELKAIVAFAPLEDPGVGAHLDRLPRHRLVTGIRRNTQDEADPMFCASPAFIAGAARLADHKLVCDICARHGQLEGVIELVRAVPQTTIVLNHLGKPEIGSDLSPWRQRMSALAHLSSVHVKMSVVVHGTETDRWPADEVSPVVEHALETFGPARVLWGSNWPVAPLVTPYADWFALAQDLTKHFSDSKRAAVFHDNATRLYGITD